MDKNKVIDGEVKEIKDEEKKERKFQLPKIPKPVRIVGEVVIGALAVVGGLGVGSMALDKVRKPKDPMTTVSAPETDPE